MVTFLLTIDISSAINTFCRGVEQSGSSSGS
jgi:hypothetical protein